MDVSCIPPEVTNPTKSTVTNPTKPQHTVGALAEEGLQAVASVCDRPRGGGGAAGLDQHAGCGGHACSGEKILYSWRCMPLYRAAECATLVRLGHDWRHIHSRLASRPCQQRIRATLPPLAERHPHTRGGQRVCRRHHQQHQGGEQGGLYLTVLPNGCCWTHPPNMLCSPPHQCSRHLLVRLGARVQAGASLRNFGG